MVTGCTRADVRFTPAVATGLLAKRRRLTRGLDRRCVARCNFQLAVLVMGYCIRPHCGTSVQGHHGYRRLSDLWRGRIGFRR